MSRTKRCSKCGVEKPIENFWMQQRRKDGRHTWCRVCCQVYYLSRKPEGYQVRAYPDRRNVLSPNIVEKRCTRCGLVKSIDEFGRYSRYPDGRQKRCQACLGIQRRTRTFSRGSLERRVAWEREYYERNRARILINAKTQNDELRAEVLVAYGHRCACCGEGTAEFLAIDHIHGRGNRDTKVLALSGRPLYLWLKRHGFPRDGLRLLCHNCNTARAHYGYCPHQEEHKEVVV